MFTGIIETLGTVERIQQGGENFHFTISSSISSELKIDQSLSHNGVCLTVVALGNGTHTVTAISETMKRSSLGDLHPGDFVNLERAMQLGDRLDGHMVQGHVDGTATVDKIVEEDGSWRFTFSYNPGPEVLVQKGSVTVDGVSLTVIDPAEGSFSVAIIPYTMQHTRFGKYGIGSRVNLEYDIIGKYISALLARQKSGFMS